MSRMLSKMNLISVVQQLSKEDIKTIQGYVEMIEKENQSLKEQVDYLRRSIERKEETIIELEQERVPYTNEYVEELKQQYLNAVADYEQEKFNVEELKKQLEDITLCRDIASGHRKEVQDRETILLNQQKEFIEYLEEEMKKNINWYNSLSPHDKNYYYKNYADKDGNYMVVLSKYKEIIGVSNENNTYI